jgi:hypothetical protein
MLAHWWDGTIIAKDGPYVAIDQRDLAMSVKSGPLRRENFSGKKHIRPSQSLFWDRTCNLSRVQIALP